MTGTSLAAALVERGMEPAEVPSKVSLFDVVLGAFRDFTGDQPRQAWWVPGRLEVFGKHTDYAGGHTLVAAVPRGIAVTARPRADGTIRVMDARRGDRMTLGPLDEARYRGWRHYVEVVARRLATNFPGAHLGADIVFAGDLPRASGMSSSSALVVAMSAALVQVAGIESRPEWQAHIRSPIDTAGYFACIENGMAFGTLLGDAGVGTHGGSEDHAAILAGRPGELSAFAFVPMRHLADVRVPDDWRFVLAPSVVRSSKTGAEQDAYNRLARGAQALLELWNADGRRASSIASAIASDPAAANLLRDRVRASAIGGWSAEALEKRLDHFIREDARAPQALDAFRAVDAARLGELAAGSQADAEELLGNQVPETSELARSARAHGAFASCSFGAGFGGSVWALVARDEAASFAARWSPSAFVAAPGPPLTALPIDLSRS
ncbi:MAG TPA: galactokinase family protein [Vicinamibacterales bacterium]|nr:galactokinase family protein [Vicinamibacterales bacterium]